MTRVIFDTYIQTISTKYSFLETSEMGYRTDLEILLKGVFETINVKRIDHDAKAREGNKPDFVVIQNDIPILYIEAKDIGVSLDKVEKSEQMSRYFGYANLVLTDYVEFRFYRNGLSYGEPIKIAECNKNTRTISAYPKNFEYLAKTLVDFTQSNKEPIRSGKHLSKIMGGKAQRIRDNIRLFLSVKSERNIELVQVYETIKKLLVHDLSEDAFADMYAQTLVYGLFVARFYDESPSNFTRQEARDLIPKSNPLLRHFFDHIVGPNFDKRLEYIVDELCEVFSHADVEKLMSQYLETNLKGKTHRRQDTVVHFYEDFLNEYDAILRKKMGAYYTPLPVVEFIVRSVDELLRKEFNLSKGLADTSKLSSGQHKVQVLDPAVGTGTFISAVIGEIYRNFKDQEGRWPTYVHNDLLPRIHGFELMMAPYTIAHLKLGLSFKETGFKYFNRRLGIYLTNSLEEAPNQDSLLTAFGLAESIAEESKVAGVIKNEAPIMVVVGNPPYSASSSNKGEWIQSLISAYKLGLKEQNINSLSDDYVKFIRFAENFIEKNRTGIVAMITNNSFIDGITHRQMRKHLLETFDKIYILNLHGNSKKKETTPSGGKDENVFDIQQGVSINIFVRNIENKKSLGKIYHADLYGTRKYKLDTLNAASLNSIDWEKLEYSDPYYFFVPKDFEQEEKYSKGFGVDELFVKFGSGTKFRKDNLLVKNHFSKESVEKLLHDMNTLDNSSIQNKYDFKDTTDWKLIEKKVLFRANDLENIIPTLYKPFDIRYTYYPIDTIGDIIPRGDSRKGLMKHLLKDNVALITKRGVDVHGLATVTNKLFEIRVFSNPGSQGTDYGFPLYLYQDNGMKSSNLRVEIVNKIEDIVGKTSPENIFDYIYAVLHSFSYKEKYNELLKIDFPRILYPTDRDTYQELGKLGKELRLLHLFQSPETNKFITSYPEPGRDNVEKIEYVDGNVYINENQYFGNVPKEAWRFWVGGYQPAQRWLKDRKGQILANSDIEHYQKMIVTMVETDRIAKEIDRVIRL